jgi:aerobic C4-dicarboxylate transport protein
VSSQSQGLVLPPSAAVPEAKKKLYQHLYFQVLCAIVIGILLGHFYPSLGESMKPLGDGFIKLIKMLIAPIIFFTVVHGIASTGDLKKVGRVGIKALIYFEVMTTLALAIGYISMKLVEPGVGMNVDPSTLDATAIQGFTAKAKEQGIIEYLMHIIPSTVVGAFAEGDILQVLLLAILFAFALQFMGERGKPLLAIIDTTSHAFFGMVGIVMKVAPLGAFGAMAFTIGKYGIVSLLSNGNCTTDTYCGNQSLADPLP